MALDDVLRNFDREVSQMKTAGEKAIYEVGSDLLRESNELTPFKDGNLRKSGKLKMRRGRMPIATVSYGDSRVDYAAIIHEEKAKLYSEPGTSWKYLERPLKRNSVRYIKYIQ